LFLPLFPKVMPLTFGTTPINAKNTFYLSCSHLLSLSPDE
jgi:hypothetical protein